MEIIRFIDSSGAVRTGCDFENGIATLVDRPVSDRFVSSTGTARVKRILAPVEPRAIFCVGLNYRMHAAETGAELPKHPVIFMKNPAAATGPDSSVVIPTCCADPPEVDFEAELAVVIGKTARNVSPPEALEHVLGYCCANDISARRWQKHGGGGQWVRGKSFDTFCPLGPVLVTRDAIADPQDLAIECRLNGQTMQKGTTADMIFSVAQIVSYLSESTTLLPDTVILTGTPSGVGFTRTPPVWLKPGDRLETTVGSIGTLVNTVEAES